MTKTHCIRISLAENESKDKKQSIFKNIMHSKNTIFMLWIWCRLKAWITEKKKQRIYFEKTLEFIVEVVPTVRQSVDTIWSSDIYSTDSA